MCTRRDLRALLAAVSYPSMGRRSSSARTQIVSSCLGWIQTSRRMPRRQCQKDGERQVGKLINEGWERIKQEAVRSKLRRKEPKERHGRERMDEPEAYAPRT